jgi:hypothetical protein
MRRIPSEALAWLARRLNGHSLGLSLSTRLSWPHKNSHRLDLKRLTPVKSVDISEPESCNRRGFRVNGKVLPVENRHFSHWNTDPGIWITVATAMNWPPEPCFSSYYMGLYHGYMKP